MKIKFAPTTLAHLTLNTGHVCNSPIYKVHERAIQALAPLVRAGGGAIPACPGWSCDITCDTKGAAFSFSFRRIPVVLCTLAWDADNATELWASAVDSIYLKSAELPDLPVSVPWLAVNLLPTSLVFCSASDMGMLGDLERCLAWAIIKTSKEFPYCSPHSAN